MAQYLPRPGSMWIASLLLAPLFCAATATPFAASAEAAETKHRVTAPAPRKPDLGDVVAGVYEGAVVADARGGSRSGVEISVKRVSKNLVEISSDYDRIPTVRIALTRATDAIIAARPGDGFLIEQAKDAKRLDLSIDGVTLIVRKQ